MSVYKIISEQVKANCISEVEKLYGGYEVVIRKAKRSLPQNRYLHSLIDILSDHTGDTPDELKLKLKYEFLPLHEINVNGKVYMYPVSTAELTKEQCTQIIERVLMIFQVMGLVAPLPSFYGLEEKQCTE